MEDRLLRTYVWLRTLAVHTIGDERGEGVVSAAIAVLIMASLGALMWVGFKAIWGNAQSSTQDQVGQIGR